MSVTARLRAVERPRRKRTTGVWALSAAVAAARVAARDGR